VPAHRITVAAVGVALAGFSAALAGCGTDPTAPGPSASRQIILIQSSGSAGSAVKLARGARAQATRSGYRLTVEDPARPTMSDQIAIVNAVIASKPAAVVITPDGGEGLAASLQSMRSGGIKVIEIHPDGHSDAEREGADAVRRAVSALLTHEASTTS
jgi:ribose transport system substrate-binding protein